MKLSALQLLALEGRFFNCSALDPVFIIKK